jgi:hypothetical protein
MAVVIKDVPLSTRLAPKAVRGLKPETIRQKARLVIKPYDEGHYIVGLKRGNKYVKKFLIENRRGQQAVSMEEAEKNIRQMVLAGEFDRPLIEEYVRRKRGGKSSVKRPRGRPPKKK